MYLPASPLDFCHPLHPQPCLCIQEDPGRATEGTALAWGVGRQWLLSGFQSPRSLSRNVDMGRLKEATRYRLKGKGSRIQSRCSSHLSTT